MAAYRFSLLDPFGTTVFEHRVELEDLEYPEGTVDQLTALMMTEGVQAFPGKGTVVRRFIRGGFDPRAAYSVQLERL